MTVGKLKELIAGVDDDAMVTISYDGNRIIFGAPTDAASSVDETAKQSDPHNWGAKNWKEGHAR